jgi:hypothetical protein
MIISIIIFYHDPEIGPNQIVSRSIFETSCENLKNRMITIWPKREMSKKRLPRLVCADETELEAKGFEVVKIG